MGFFNRKNKKTSESDSRKTKVYENLVELLNDESKDDSDSVKLINFTSQSRGSFCIYLLNDKVVQVIDLNNDLALQMRLYWAADVEEAEKIASGIISLSNVSLKYPKIKELANQDFQPEIERIFKAYSLENLYAIEANFSDFSHSVENELIEQNFEKVNFLMLDVQEISKWLDTEKSFRSNFLKTRKGFVEKPKEVVIKLKNNEYTPESDEERFLFGAASAENSTWDQVLEYSSGFILSDVYFTLEKLQKTGILEVALPLPKTKQLDLWKLESFEAFYEDNPNVFEKEIVHEEFHVEDQEENISTILQAILERNPELMVNGFPPDFMTNSFNHDYLEGIMVELKEKWIPAKEALAESTKLYSSLRFQMEFDQDIDQEQFSQTKQSAAESFVELESIESELKGYNDERKEILERIIEDLEFRDFTADLDREESEKVVQIAKEKINEIENLEYLTIKEEFPQEELSEEQYLEYMAEEEDLINPFEKLNEEAETVKEEKEDNPPNVDFTFDAEEEDLELPELGLPEIVDFEEKIKDEHKEEDSEENSLPDVFPFLTEFVDAEKESSPIFSSLVEKFGFDPFSN